MQSSCTKVQYQETGYFSKIVRDYLSGDPALRPFYAHAPDLNGIDAAIANRQRFQTDRALIHRVLTEQYAAVEQHDAVAANLQLLLKDTSFTVITAHQPALFTGPLYFIYKILHTIRLAATLKKERPQFDFVPVFYMGSEDADLDELGKFFMNGDKIIWDTDQKGAVGRMKLKGIEALINRVAGELSIQPHGPALIQMLKEAYQGARDVQTATFQFIHKLFAGFGLLVLIPDARALKAAMAGVFEEELFKQSSSAIVEKTNEQLSSGYKVQASPREINLFYLKDDIRERIEREGDHFKVVRTEITFTDDEIRAELSAYPERFSPNVILRGLFQETILPNIAFIGGGGELAYWLELKDLFAHYKTPYPVLVLRNSFLLVEEKWRRRIEKLSLNDVSLFHPVEQQLTDMVTRNRNGELRLKTEFVEVEQLYRQLRAKAEHIDQTLGPHIEALHKRATKPLRELEKKMLRAEKRRFEDERRQLIALKQTLFPTGNLQERIESFMPFYASYGPELLQVLYAHSLSLEQLFAIVDLRD